MTKRSATIELFGAEPISDSARLSAIGVTKSYWRGVWPRRREIPVLRGADLSVGAGEVVGLAGEDGSGKSMFMKILVGALAADDGRVVISGRMGYCPPETILYERLTCDEHLDLFGVAYGMNHTRSSLDGWAPRRASPWLPRSVVWWPCRFEPALRNRLGFVIRGAVAAASLSDARANRPGQRPRGSARRCRMVDDVGDQPADVVDGAARPSDAPGASTHATSHPISAEFDSVDQPVSSTSVSPTLVVGLPIPPAVQAWQPRGPTPGSSKRFGAVLASGGCEFSRNQVLWALLAGVPAVFIVMAVMITVDKPGPLALVEGARHYTSYLSERRIHAATMVPIAASFLAGLTGLFVVTESAAGDRRLVIAGFRAREVLAGRVGVINAATVLTAGVAIAVSGAFYGPSQWIVFSVANLLIALTYAMIGVLVGTITGRLGGLYVVLILAFMDVGLGQSVMFPNAPPAWGAYLPARGASRVMIDGAFTSGFDELPFLLLGLGWLVVFGTAATTMYRRRMES